MTNTMSDNDSTTVFGGTRLFGGASETNEKDLNDFWEDDGISLTGNPYYSGSDYINFSSNGAGAGETIAFTGSGVRGGMGEDYISFNSSVPDLPDLPDNKNGFWKYNEDVILKEIREYLGGTYQSHYASSESKTQTLDLIESVGDAEPFCRSNAIKYLSRFGKKNGKSKQDILKAIHYCILLYHFAGLCDKKSDYPY